MKCCIKAWVDFHDESGKVTEKLKELLKKYEMIGCLIIVIVGYHYDVHLGLIRQQNSKKLCRT